jgi:hypothetical protein
MTATPEIRETCPDWCAGDHVADDYLQDGHVVHHAIEVSSNGHPVLYWQSVDLRTERVEPVQLHLGTSFTRFENPEHLRVYAEDLLSAADTLDMMNG